MAKKTQNDLESSDPLQDSGSPEWPCKPTVESSGWPSKWPSITTPSTLQTPLPTPEDEAANKGQLPALLAVSEYLNSTLSLDDDDDDDFSDDEDEFQDYDFFVKLFKQDEGLRDYYVKNKENGVFCCLVCCGVREKGWKRFKNCAVLVQHAVSIAKTKKRRAHRAYSQVVCEVLGWDVNKLPSVVISADDESSDELVKAQGDADNGGLSGQCKTLRNTEASLSEESFISESQLGKCGGSSVEWPCNPTIESSGWPSKWPSITTPSKLQTPLPTPEDEAANKGQLQALLAVSEYLNSTLSLDDDDDDFSEDDGEGFNDYDFFVKLFNQDEGLREYYEKNKESGVFCCLVCCGVREKGWKRFKNCATLVQHAVTVAKTKKRRAHRAYSQVVCEIIGWDFNRLPSIVLSAGDKLGEAVAEENAVSKAGADGLLEDRSYTIPETLKGNEEGASNCVEPPKECPVIANEKKDCQKDDDVHKNLQEDVNHELLALTIGDAN